MMLLQAEKAMRVLENRVEQGYHRLNARRAATRALRNAIDGVRKERLATAELQRKHAQQLSAARACAADLLRSAHAARLARDKARTLPVSLLSPGNDRIWWFFAYPFCLGMGRTPTKLMTG